MNAGPQQSRLISLAAGVVQEFPPEQVVYAAAEAGFNAVGIWCELETWTSARTDAVKSALSETGIKVLDIEVAWFHPGEAIDTHDAIVDIAKAISAKNILCVSSEAEIGQTKKRFKHLCQRVQGSDIRVALEFLAITEINTLARALEVVNEVGHPAGAVLVDTLHLFRTGAGVEELAALEQNTVSYLQLCDATATLVYQSLESVLDDALFLRNLPGQGELPLAEILQAVDANLPLSMEIRSRALIDEFPALQDRANAVFERTQQFFRSLKM